MTAAQRCLTGVMRARCKAKYDDFMKLIRQQFREQPTFRDATMYSCSRETKSEKRLQKFHTDDASRHDQSEEPHRSW